MCRCVCTCMAIQLDKHTCAHISKAWGRMSKYISSLTQRMFVLCLRTTRRHNEPLAQGSAAHLLREGIFRALAQPTPRTTLGCHGSGRCRPRPFRGLPLRCRGRLLPRRVGLHVGAPQCDRPELPLHLRRRRPRVRRQGVRVPGAAAQRHQPVRWGQAPEASARRTAAAVMVGGQFARLSRLEPPTDRQLGGVGGRLRAKRAGCSARHMAQTGCPGVWGAMRGMRC